MWVLVLEAIRGAGPQGGNVGCPGLCRGGGCCVGRLEEAGTLQAPVTNGLLDYSGLCSAPGPVLTGNLRGPFKWLRVSLGLLGGRLAPLPGEAGPPLPTQAPQSWPYHGEWSGGHYRLPTWSVPGAQLLPSRVPSSPPGTQSPARMRGLDLLCSPFSIAHSGRGLSPHLLACLDRVSRKLSGGPMGSPWVWEVRDGGV